MAFCAQNFQFWPTQGVAAKIRPVRILSLSKEKEGTHMAINRQKKEKIVQDLHSRTESASILVFIGFHKLSVVKMSKLRKALRGVGAELKVAKKRLVKRVLDGFGFSGVLPDLKGEVGVLTASGDAIEPTKVLSKFAKDKEYEGLSILGGVFEKGYVANQAIKQLAAIPPREVLLGQLVYAISSPLKGFVRALSGPMRNMVGVLNNLAKK